MNIKIVSDSTCDLSPELVKKYGVAIVPLTVVAGENQYQDGVDFTPNDVFKYFDSTGNLCSTTAINESTFAEMFAELSPKYDAVIHISIGTGFSSCYQNACLAAKNFPNVFVVDSENLSTGQGLLVIEASLMAAEGLAPEDICEKLRNLATRVEASFIIDRLDYMSKGGRCSSVTALGANLLRIKPCIAVLNGQMIVDKKFRGRLDKCIKAYIIDRLRDRDDIVSDRVFITYTSTTEEIRKVVYENLVQFGQFKEILETHAGCTVACHSGPLTLGILFIRK